VKRVLSLCDKTGIMVQPWLDAGYAATIVDIQHPAGVTVDGRLTRLGVSVLDLSPPTPGSWDAVFAFPPCTHLASSGARWFKDKGLPSLIEALTLVEACRRLAEGSGAPWMLENPVGTLATYWRRPDYYFDPCDFGGYLPNGGDAYTKRTCLWTGAGFVMPPAKGVAPVEGSKMHRLPETAERANLRSATPAGFAQAVFEANRKQPSEAAA
jgi:hypothetical protein